MSTTLKGRKGSTSQPKSAQRFDDNLFGQDTVEVLLALGEGPFEGLKDGASSFFVGDVPLLDKGTNTPNISNFELRLLKGTNPADSIRLNLGGFASTKNVGLPLRTMGQSLVVQGDKTQIDYLDVRIAINRLLLLSTTGGEWPNQMAFGIEVKPRSSSVWQIPFTNEPPPPDSSTSGASNYRPGATTPGSLVNAAYHETYLAPGNAPPVQHKAVGAMWFITDLDPWSPRIWDGSGWQVPNNLGRADVVGFATWTWTDYDGAARRAWISPNGSAPPPELISSADFLVTPQAGAEVYSYNDTSWVGTQSFAETPTVAPGIVRIDGLARSTVPKEYRIPVARINEPYDVRITRWDNPTTKDNFKDWTVESIQEVVRDVYSFPDLALAWLTIKATDTFTQIPDFTGIYRGGRIPVPSNHVFNEQTNLPEYLGLWDGTFKIAYTNSPAWHAYNFIKNSRYGKNSYFPEVPDQWDFYEFGKHCAAHGFRFNEYVQEPRSLNELINYIVGIAGGRYVDRGDGYSTVIWDADNQVARAIFAPENTIEGSFTYSFTDVTERKNDFKVSFKNPGLNYNEDRVRVWDQNTIDVTGRNAEEFVAVGCRDPEEAVKRGRLRLATSLSEKIIVSFKTNRLGRYLLPFEVILIADDQSTNVISGRTRNTTAAPIGTVSLPLRDQIYLEAGVSYSAQFTVSDGDGGLRVVSYPLTVAQPGLQNRLVFSQATAEELPEYAVFSIGAPKPFRITSISPVDGDNDQIDITAIEVNRLKWAFVDGKVELRDLVGLQTGALSKFVYPVTNAKITPETTSDGRFNLLVSWNPSETKLLRGYRLYQSINKQPTSIIAEPTESFWRIQNVVQGVYYVTIVGVSLDGTTESAPVTVQYTITDQTSLRSVAGPTNLRLLDEPEAPIFRAVDPRFAWDASADPLVDHYVVEVLNGAGAAVRRDRVPVSGQLLFQYTLAMNKADNGGSPIRQFTVRVSAVDSGGNASQPISLVVSHPPPAIITPQLDAVSEVIFVSYSAPAGDFQGVLVWMESASGYNPLATAPRYDGPNTFIPLPAVPETTYYLRLAGYDSYGKTGLNIGPELIKKATILLFDPMPPAIPDKPVLTTEVEVAPDGTVTSVVRARWTLDTSGKLGRYEIAYAQSEANTPEQDKGYVTDGADKASWEKRGFTPGKLVSLKVRAGNKDGYPSDYSPVATITAAANLTPPRAATGLAVTGGFQNNFLKWTASTSKDVDYQEVWFIGGTSSAAEPPSGAALLAKVGPQETSYADGTMPTVGTRTYWVRPVNTSGVAATTYAGPASGTSAQIVAGQLAAGVIDATKMAASLAVPVVVTSLPSAKTSQFVTLQSDGRLYRWDATLNNGAGGYTAAVDVGQLEAAKLTGQLTSDQIASIAAAKVAGQLTSDQIAAIAAAKITGQIVASQIANIAAGQITGQLTSDQIAGLTAAKITGQITKTQISDNAIDTPQLSAGAVKAANIFAGAVTASKLSIGSVNLMPCGDFSQGTPGVTFGYNTTGKTQTVPLIRTDFAPAGMRAATASLSGGPTPAAGTVFGLAFQAWDINQNAKRIPVVPGTTYEASAYLSLHRCTGVIFLEFFDANGSLVSAPQSNTLPENGAKGGPLSTFPRAGVIGVAPANAVTMLIEARGTCTGGADPYLFAAGIMFGPVPAGTVELSPYVDPGVTTIAGGNILTNSIQASAIVSKSITAGQIAAGTLTATEIAARAITADQIAVNTIVGGNIAARTITAGNIVVGTLTADLIAARTITATNIVVGTLTGNEIAANSVNADRLVANSITAAKIAAGAISTAQLAAGAVTADKIGVGLGVGNLLWNSDRALDGWITPYLNTAGSLVQYRSDFAVYGYKNVCIYSPGTPAANQFDFFDLQFPNSANAADTRIPITAGQQYEFSVYLSMHRAAGYVEIIWLNDAGSEVGRSSSTTVENNTTSGFPSDGWRARGMGTAPANAAYATFRTVRRTNGGNEPYLFASCFYFAQTAPGATVYSPYAPQSRTVITGGQIATNSLSADKIVAGSITGDRIAGGTIVGGNIAANTISVGNLVAGTLSADNISVGNGSVSSLINGSNTTKIQGGAIAANSITANLLKIGSRMVQIAGISFYMERDGNGNINNVLHWTAGHIFYTDNNGNAQAQAIPDTRITINGAYWYIWFNQASPGNFGCAQDNWGNIYNDPNCILIATVSNLTGISVMVGGTIIDGTRIVTRSIQADQIAANAIQAIHISANSIHGDKIIAASIWGDRIAVGSLTADRITSGTLTVNAEINMGGPQTQIWSDTNGGGLRVRSRNLDQWRFAAGYLGPWTGDANDFGLIVWGSDGNARVRFSNALNYIDGVIITDATISKAKIGDLQVDTIKIANGSISQVAAAAGGDSAAVGITVRTEGGRVLIQAVMKNDPNQSRTNRNPGSMYIYWDRNGDPNARQTLDETPKNFWLNPGVAYYWGTTSTAVVAALPAGYHVFHVYTNAAGNLGCTISVTELAK